MKSSFDQFLSQVMDQAQRTIGPDALDSVESMVASADRVGEAVLDDVSAWQGKRAVVLQMPKRRRRPKKR
jgi:hypothetical protein